MCDKLFNFKSSLSLYNMIHLMHLYMMTKLLIFEIKFGV